MAVIISSGTSTVSSGTLTNPIVTNTGRVNIRSAASMTSAVVSSGGQVHISGDFDGNGSHDIAMINDVGVVGIWGVNDGYLSSWSILSAVTSEWQLAGVADFNADGTDDIAWANSDTGLTGYWQINNKELTTWANIVTLS